jgi:hypothetical protein
VVRAAADKPGVLYAFIVLDSPQAGGGGDKPGASGSILDMQVCGCRRSCELRLR